MPWKRAKVLPPPDNSLFEACFRIQREACEAANRYIPLVVENVRGAQKWVGRADWHFGSYFLWGDVPALMPFVDGQKFNPDGTGHPPGSWFAIADSINRGSKTQKHINKRNGHSHTRHLTSPTECLGIKQHGSGPVRFDTGVARLGSKSDSRKAASAQIAKIPFPLAQHVARVFKAASI
jgi:hypothetical protein